MEILFILVALIAFSIFFALILTVISKVGWASIASVYPADADFQGTKLKFRSCMVNAVSYKGSVILGANAEGLFMDVFFLFRPGHKAIFIPWSDISLSKQKKFWVNYTQITATGIPKHQILLLQQDAKKLIAQSKNNDLLSQESKADEDLKKASQPKGPQKCSDCGQEILPSDTACSMCGKKFSSPGIPKKENTISFLLWGVIFFFTYAWSIIATFSIIDDKKLVQSEQAFVFFLIVLCPLSLVHSIRFFYRKFFLKNLK